MGNIRTTSQQDVVSVESISIQRKSSQNRVFSQRRERENNPFRDKPVVHGRYYILQKLGAGAFGTCYLISDNDKGYQKFAMKSIRIPKHNPMDPYMKEIEMMRSCNHPHIVKIYSAFVINHSPRETEEDEKYKYLCIVMEFCNAGNLDDMIKGMKNNSETIKPQVSWRLFIQLLETLQYIHEKNIIHRDIKPENIMLSYTGTGDPNKDFANLSIKITDFGVGRFISAKSLGKTKTGTLLYCSPEILSEKGVKYDGRCDIWSLGIVFSQVIAQFNTEEYIEKVQNFARSLNSIQLVLKMLGCGMNANIALSLLIRNPENFKTFLERECGVKDFATRTILEKMIAPYDQRYSAKKILEMSFIANMRAISEGKRIDPSSSTDIDNIIILLTTDIEFSQIQISLLKTLKDLVETEISFVVEKELIEKEFLMHLLKKFLGEAKKGKDETEFFDAVLNCVLLFLTKLSTEGRAITSMIVVEMEFDEFVIEFLKQKIFTYFQVKKNISQKIKEGGVKIKEIIGFPIIFLMLQCINSERSQKKVLNIKNELIIMLKVESLKKRVIELFGICSKYFGEVIVELLACGELDFFTFSQIGLSLEDNKKFGASICEVLLSNTGRLIDNNSPIVPKLCPVILDQIALYLEDFSFYDKICSSHNCCTYSKCGKNYISGNFFHCNTCYPGDNSLIVCEQCVSQCHFGHDVQPVKSVSRGYCDCIVTNKCILKNNNTMVDHLKVQFESPPSKNCEYNEKSKVGGIKIIRNRMCQGEGLIVSSEPICVFINDPYGRGDGKTIGFFETTFYRITDLGKIVIGFTHRKDGEKYLVDEQSIGLEINDGMLNFNGKEYRYFSKVMKNDVVGCGITDQGKVYFTLNKKLYPLPPIELKFEKYPAKVYAIICSEQTKMLGHINFGKRNFTFSHSELRMYRNPGDEKIYNPNTLLTLKRNNNLLTLKKVCEVTQEPTDNFLEKLKSIETAIGFQIKDFVSETDESDNISDKEILLRLLLALTKQESKE